jgi:hypothetical protein
MSISYNGSVLIEVAGVTRLDREHSRLRITVDESTGGIPAGTKLDSVVDGDDVYGRRVGSSHWVRSSGRTDQLAFNTGFSDSLDYLSAVTGNVETAGTTDTPFSTDVRLYKATVDLERVADKLPAGERDRYRERLDKVGLPTRLPIEVGLDEEGRIVKMDYNASVGGQDLEIDVAFHDFGARGDFSVPKHFTDAP